MFLLVYIRTCTTQNAITVILLVGGCCGVGVGWRVVDVPCTTVDWEDASVLAELVSGGVRRCEEGGGEGGVWMEEIRG